MLFRSSQGTGEGGSAVGNIGSTAVIVSKELPPLRLVTNAPTEFSYQVPADTFRHSEPGTPLAYSVQLVNGNALPSWVTFDGGRQRFSGVLPTGQSAVIDVRIQVRDPMGNQASTLLRIELSG